ncbi:MAG: hypothetical protein LBP76_04210 [Treponema sp.]|jgi:hypothetical protein|nr:hypothetical protein [Treponema sp.]
MKKGSPPKRGNYQLIACALFLFVLAPFLFAGGKAEAELSPADELIKNKQYDEAISFLSDYLKKNPDRIELVQKRMNIILEKKEEYYRIAEELLDTVENDWENFEKILYLGSRLEEMEKSANYGNHQFLEQAQMIAQYKYFYKRLVEILDEGRRLLERGAFIEAFDKYAEGLDMYQKDFFAADFGEPVKSRVREDLEILNRNMAALRGLAPRAYYISGALQQERLDRTAEAEFAGEHYGELWSALSVLRTIKNDLIDMGNYFKTQQSLLQASEHEWENVPFLAFATQLFWGPDKEIADVGSMQEGMLGAVEGLGDSFNKYFYKCVLEILDDGRNLLEQGDYAGAFVKYMEGLEIYHTDFFPAELGAIAKARMGTDIEKLKRALEEFREISPRFRSVADALQQDNLHPAGGGAYYDDLWPALGMLRTLKNDLVELAAFFETQQSLLQTSGYEWEYVSFLSFAPQFVLGPEREGGAAQGPNSMQEGMLGAVNELGSNLNEYFYKSLAKILDAGRNLLEKGDYMGAFAQYTEGLAMYQEDFFASVFGDTLTTQVREDLEILNRDLKEFVEFSPRLLSVSDAVQQEILDPSRTGFRFTGRHYDELWTVLDMLIAIKDDLVKIGNFFKTQQALLQTTEDGWEHVSFLSFAPQFVLGPDKEIAGPSQGPDYMQEGMLGAVDGLWNTIVPALTDAVIRNAEQTYAAGINSVIEDRGEVTLSYLEAARGLSLIPLKLIVKRYEFRKPNQPPEDSVFNTAGLVDDMPDYLKFTAINRSIDYVKDAFTLGKRYTDLMTQDFKSLEQWRSGRQTPDALREKEIAIQNSFISLYTDIDSYLERLNAEIAYIGTQETPAARRGYEEFIAYINSIQAKLHNRRELAAGEEFNAVIREYTIANGELQKRVPERQAELAEGKGNIEGKPYPLPGQPEYIAHYPQEALETLNRMLASISQDIAVGKELIAQYGREPPYIQNDERVRALAAEALNIQSLLESIFADGSSSASAANARVAVADRYRQQGDEMYREAERILNRNLSDNDVDLARDQMDNASAQYDASLAVQESADFRAERDARIFDLGMRIQERQNEIIIRQIRTWITEAQQIYMTGNFEQAITLLERAEERNREINSTDDPEIVYWLNIARAALMLQAYQVIVSTAPLYTEVSQLLSDARKNYAEGTRLLRTRHEEGIRLFNEARKKIEEVLLMFPVNKEAGVLMLRMDQVQNPETFEQQFKDRFEKAVAEINAKRAGASEAYTDLQNLAEIYPNYPGMKSALDRAYRIFNPIVVAIPQERRQTNRPQPAPQQQAPAQQTAETARIRGLIASVRDVINRKDSANYQNALGQLNQVFQMEPTNSDYPGLKDALNRLIGGQGTITLDSVSESLYQKAIREFQQGNNLVAMSIVQQIKKMPGNEKNTRILQLERRIQSIL